MIVRRRNLRAPVDIDYDPFVVERVDTESTEIHSGKDGNGSEDDQGEEVHEEGEGEITRPGGKDLFSFERVFCQHNSRTSYGISSSVARERVNSAPGIPHYGQT